MSTSAPGPFSVMSNAPENTIITCFSARLCRPTWLPGCNRSHSMEKPCGLPMGAACERSCVMPWPMTGATWLAWPGKQESSSAEDDQARCPAVTTRRSISSLP